MKKAITISLAVLMLLSSLGINMATHYCGGEAVMTMLTLGNEHLDCGMGEMVQTCSSKPSFQKQACCENDYKPLHIEDDYKSGVQMQQVFGSYALILVSFIEFQFTSTTTDSPEYQEYIPPLIDQDKQVMLQTFRI